MQSFLAKTDRGHARPVFMDKVSQFYSERVGKSWGGGHILRGRTPGPGDILLVSNDYLALANHSAIVQAQSRELLRSGNGLMMSGIFLHGDNPQLNLEQELADFLGAEAVVLCQSGWCANTGLIQSIADASVPVYLDVLAHMSLWEGARSAGAMVRPFRHNDAAHLESLIRRHGPGVVAVDAVYSTNGSICPLPDFAMAARRLDCVLVVDESHSLGTHGPRGEGLVPSLGLEALVHFRTASLAKAFVGRAGLIACPAGFADYFKFTSRPAIFSSTLLPHEIAGLRTTLDLVRREAGRRERLHAHAASLRKALRELGYPVGDSASQIIALEAGSELHTIVLRDALEARGIFGSVFCAPATAARRSLVRLSVNAGLSAGQVARVIEVCAEIRDEVGARAWPSAVRAGRAGRVT